jgi:hypothetical protein
MLNLGRTYVKFQWNAGDKQGNWTFFYYNKNTAYDFNVDVAIGARMYIYRLLKLLKLMLILHLNPFFLL